MGQAILDLPDPTQLSGVNAGPLSPQALASADDLLSQLAGDDIDRLLAEAEAERSLPVPPPPPAPPLAAAPPVAEATAPDLILPTEAAIAAILAPAIDSTLKAVDEQIAASAPVDTALAAEPILPPPSQPPAAPLEVLDQHLLDEAAAHVSAIMDVPVAPPEPISVAPVAVADAAERRALSEPLIIPPVPARSSRRISVLVKILEWINSPMLLFPDAVREAIGKVAILTTFNAAAVIVYVMVFRRPHH
jgi:hypothetical protein